MCPLSEHVAVMAAKIGGALASSVGLISYGELAVLQAVKLPLWCLHMNSPFVLPTHIFKSVKNF